MNLSGCCISTRSCEADTVSSTLKVNDKLACRLPSKWNSESDSCVGGSTISRACCTLNFGERDLAPPPPKKEILRFFQFEIISFQFTGAKFVDPFSFVKLHTHTTRTRRRHSGENLSTSVLSILLDNLRVVVPLSFVRDDPLYNYTYLFVFIV